VSSGHGYVEWPPRQGPSESIACVWVSRPGETTGSRVLPDACLDIIWDLLVLGGGSAGVEVAQVVRRLGGEAVLIEGADRVLPHEPAPLGEALGEALRRDGIELMLGMHAAAARREGDEYVLAFDGGTDLRGDWLLVATGRRPRTGGIGLETAGATFDQRGIRVDEHLRAGERRWAIGDVNGIWPLTAAHADRGHAAAGRADERADGEPAAVRRTAWDFCSQAPPGTR
jgi:pyruvate/2-oxoglutarate dehydrogenase complex dihydrolipoamide dehydrogenase (E3) component